MNRLLRLGLTLLPLWLSAGAHAQSPRTLVDADLAPINYGPRSAEVRAALAQGLWAKAADAASGEAAEVRFARAWMRLKAAGPKNAESALVLLAGQESRVPALADDVRRMRGEALIELGRSAEAVKALAGLDDDLALRLRARALRESGATAEARTLYGTLLARTGETRAVALLGAARLEADAGDPDRALTHLKALDLEFPALGPAELGRALAKTLIAAHPKSARRFEERTAEERLARGERLLEAHRNTEAAAALEPLSKLSLDPAQTCRQRYALGRAFRKARVWKKAKAPLDEAVDACRGARHESAPWALYQQAQVLERLGLEAESAAAYEALRTAHVEHSLADDAGFYLVKHQLDDVGGEKGWAAARALAEALVERHPQGDMVHEAVFFVALRALVESRWKDADAVLRLYDRLPRTGYRDHEAGRTEYWRARVDQALGRRDAAEAGFRSVLSTWPMQWYALMAYAELHRMKSVGPKAARAALREALETDAALPGLPGGSGPSWAFEVPATVDARALERALLLARLGLVDPAREALEVLFDDDTTGDLWLEAWLLDRAGAVRFSHDLLRRKLPFFRRFGPVGPGRRLWTLAYPNPFADLVVPAAKANGLEPALVWGIMREESGFNARVESWANAVGLLQLILPTAERMARPEEKPIDRERLTDPRLNVTLGARYMAHVLSTAGGASALPVLPAGYNAGEGALVRWLKARADLPLDLFVESMPFEEARGYTKRVTASYAVYRYLYFGSDALDDALPVFRATLPKPR
ncbi:MAG: lytic transglycosylase domain-containing protein [Bradymonadia bacterium]